MFSLGLDFSKPLCALGQLYVLVLFARAILSWFPIRSDSPLVPVVRFLHTVTEPLLAPLAAIANLLDSLFDR